MTTITLTPEIEDIITEQARRQGMTPEHLVLESLREKFITENNGGVRFLPVASDDWERMLDGAAVDAGVSLSNEQVGRESLYE